MKRDSNDLGIDSGFNNVFIQTDFNSLSVGNTATQNDNHPKTIYPTFEDYQTPDVQLRFQIPVQPAPLPDDILSQCYFELDRFLQFINWLKDYEMNPQVRIIIDDLYKLSYKELEENGNEQSYNTHHDKLPRLQKNLKIINHYLPRVFFENGQEKLQTIKALNYHDTPLEESNATFAGIIVGGLTLCGTLLIFSPIVVASGAATFWFIVGSGLALLTGALAKKACESPMKPTMKQLQEKLMEPHATDLNREFTVYRSCPPKIQHTEEIPESLLYPFVSTEPTVSRRNTLWNCWGFFSSQQQYHSHGHPCYEDHGAHHHHHCH